MTCLAVVQMVSGTDLEANLVIAERRLKEAVEQGARLVLFPENFALFDSTRLHSLALSESRDRGVYKRLSGWAKQYQVWIFAGSLPTLVKGSERVRSSLYVFSPEGKEIARYDKRHLFDVQVADQKGSYQESSFIEPGDGLVVVDTEIGKVGLSICYDLRFSDHFWQLRRMGAELIVVPSAFTQVTGDAHWTALLRARAIETQCYLLGANQGGAHSISRVTSGHSMIVDPWGRITAECGLGEAVILANFDKALLDDIRTKMPVLQQARG